MKYSQLALTAMLFGSVRGGGTLYQQAKGQAMKERMLAPQIIDEDGEMIRRVWIQYHSDKHDDCVHKIQRASDDKHYKLQMKYDFPKTHAVVITASEEEIKQLENDPCVKFVHDDPIRVPLKSSLRRRKMLSWNGQATSYGIELVQADQAFDRGLSGDGVTVCVIDSGFDITHDDFESSTYTGDSLDTDSLWSTDESGHGTHVTGIISMADNNKGLIGVAPEARIHVVKVFDDVSGSFVYSSALVDAAYRCRDAGAKVINMSLGGSFELEEERAVFTDLYENNGILSIASAGNDGDSSHNYPASYNDVISVGAVDRRKNLASFSQYNDKVDLVAPGVDVWSSLPKNFECEICAEKVTDYGYASLQGTSMASPHVAGVAALLWSYNTTVSVDYIRNALLASAEDLGSLDRDVSYGQGLVQAAAALDVLNATLNGQPLQDWSFIESSSTVNPETVLPACSADEILVTVDLKTDRYGNETAWEVVRDIDGFTVMAGAGYGNRKTYQTSQCLPDNCYTLTVNDSFGDGMCCDFGNGSLNVTVDGQQLLSASNFSDSESLSFGGDCTALPHEPKPEVPPCVDVTLSLLTDRFPYETGISLEDLDTNTVYWDNESFTDSSQYTFTQCIDPTGCHRFEITDSANDGVCCSYGSGSFELFYDGESVLSGGAFGSSEVYFLGESCANQA